MYDKLIKALREAHEHAMEWKRNPFRYAAFYEKAADAIEELQGKYFMMKKTAEWLAEKVPKWIPVTERLPESGVPTLICGDGNVVEQGFFDDEYGYWYDWGGNRTFVHHWMPLPEPPKEE